MVYLPFHIYIAIHHLQTSANKNVVFLLFVRIELNFCSSFFGLYLVAEAEFIWARSTHFWSSTIVRERVYSPSWLGPKA